MAKRWNSTLILVAVFILGLAGGVATMVWAWPGLHSRYFPHHRQTLTEYLKPLQLTPAQLPQVLAVYKDTGEKSHVLHMKFVPEYEKICSDFTATRAQEQDAYEPLRQEALGKLQALMTADQWTKFQAMRAEQRKNQPHNKPDVCRHLPSK